MFTKIFITLFAFFLPVLGIGQTNEIKLDCQLSLTTKGQQKGKNAEISKEEINVLLEVYDANSLLYINIVTPDTKLMGVSSFSLKGDKEIKNDSDKNKWSLTNIGKVDDMSGITTITIDRNTGSFFYVQKLTMSAGSVDVNAQGKCKKIDTSKRLF
jgi:hypothetical protein